MGARITSRWNLSTYCIYLSFRKVHLNDKNLSLVQLMITNLCNICSKVPKCAMIGLQRLSVWVGPK